MTRKLIKRIRKINKVLFPQLGIQIIIATSFTFISCLTMILMSLVLYNLFSSRVIAMKTESANQLLNQSKRGLEDYLRGKRRISDALYYSVIKDKDVLTTNFDKEFNLIYESNKGDLVNIALYTQAGKLISQVPVAHKMEKEEIIHEDWFENAFREVENLYFSRPHVPNLSDEPTEEYHWVSSLSRVVELSRNGVPMRGILLIDLKYTSLQQLLEKMNSDNSAEYIYLCDNDGNLIYHPKQAMINAGLYQEETLQKASLSDGSYEQKMNGDAYIIVTKTVSYTGWKLVSVVSKSGYNLGLVKMQYMIVLFISILILSVLVINQQLTYGITRPLIRLDSAIREMEGGALNPEISLEGPKEVEHLARTLKEYTQTIRKLMDEVMEEQELKRRSELDALQSQINPHFLYNTLDSVMWMIEDQQNDGAVYMIKELAKLLRISISKGKTIISIENEIAHAKSYMNIQQIRYKNQFTCDFEIDEDVLQCCTVKLVIQPLLENAIYHGVQGMDDDGEILIKAYRHEDEIFMDIIDNGYGMTQEQVDSLLNDTDEEEESISKKGNGVGLKNVDTRIKMRFGPHYGLHIESEREEGTLMRIRIPYLVYNEKMEHILNYKVLERNRFEVKHDEK